MFRNIKNPIAKANKHAIHLKQIETTMVDGVQHVECQMVNDSAKPSLVFNPSDLEESIALGTPLTHVNASVLNDSDGLQQSLDLLDSKLSNPKN